ncbi:MAG: polymer-forming cytoskeletal protein [Gemmatimonadales bacterium]|nr:polymer-forming cytoskeletal protein [Gemmatimonadales bacterium]
MPQTQPAKGPPPITVIAEGTQVQGSVEVTGDLRVDGAVQGGLLASGGGCEVARQGAVQVERARAHQLTVHGTLHANEVRARHVLVCGDGELVAQVVYAEAVAVERGGKLAALLEVEGRATAR